MTITADWTPTKEHEAMARALGLDLEAEVAAFRRYNNGSAVMYPDRAFAGWLRKAATRRNEKAEEKSAKSRPKTHAEAAREEVDRYQVQHPDDFDQLMAYLASHRWWESCTPAFRIEQMRQAIHQKDIIHNHLATQAKGSP